MSEQTVVHIGENSPEYVAYLLMNALLAENLSPRESRKAFLDLYAECLSAVRNPHLRKSGSDKNLPQFR